MIPHVGMFRRTHGKLWWIYWNGIGCDEQMDTRRMRQLGAVPVCLDHIWAVKQAAVCVHVCVGVVLLSAMSIWWTVYLCVVLLSSWKDSVSK